MVPTLPPELQLHILELAVPPLIRRNLNERVRLCKAFSLVHRSWTKTAQRFGNEILRLEDFDVGDTRADAIVARAVAGCKVKRLYCVLPVSMKTTPWSKFNSDGWQALAELWLMLSRDELDTLDAPNLSRLHLYDYSDLSPSRVLLNNLPTSLRYLALHEVSLQDDWSIKTLPLLETLILDCVFTKSGWPSLVPSNTQLRILCCREPFPPLQHDTLAKLPSALLHLAFAFEDAEALQGVGPAEPSVTPVVLPPSLQSFTLLTSAQYHHHEHNLPALLAAACWRGGVHARIETTLNPQYIDEWNPEEFAYSLGA